MTERSGHLPSLASITAFEAAAHFLSFTNAATHLAQTQGAISHQIRDLESRLGVRLFDRKSRGITLTDAGRLYLPFVRDALEQLRAGQRAVTRRTTRNVLTVSCSPNFAAKWLVPRLGSFQQSAPDIDLRISAAAQHVTFDNDGIDVAIRHGSGDWPTLNVTQLCREWVFPVASPHLLSTMKPITDINDLKQVVLLHDQQRAGWAQWLTANGSDPEQFDLQRGAVFSQTSLAIDAAVAAQGVALARSALVELDLREQRLVRPLTEQTSADFAYWIVCPKDVAKLSKVSRFTQWLLAQSQR